MIATNEELALLEKWKRKLCLQEWRIKLLTRLRPEEMTMNNDAVRELLNAIGALAEMSLNFYRALLNAGATKEEAFVLLQSFISATIHGNKEKSDED